MNSNFIEQEERLKEVQEGLKVNLNQLLNRCFELYGNEQYEVIAKRITNEKNYDNIYDTELQNLIRQYEYLTSVENELNVFSALLEMK